MTGIPHPAGPPADVPAGAPSAAQADAPRAARAGAADGAPSEAELRRALERAMADALHGPARGVNPQVGCVILGPTPDASGEYPVIAEGWHRGAGTPHAEVDALSKLAPGDARAATAVVTLEPCNHTGRTGPCSEALIAAGVARVVYAVSDPGPASGGGAERLRAAGIHVIAGLERDAGTELLGDWLTTARLGRPLVTVKWASSLDGRAAADDGSSQWITGPVARADVHRRRAASDAIAVGTGTIIADDASLTARTDDGALRDEQPVPVVFGTRAIPDGAAVLRHPHDVIRLDGRDLEADLAELRARGIRTLFVEGGPTLASAFARAGLVDTYLIYLAPTLLGGGRLATTDLGVGTISAQKRLVVDGVERLGDDLLVTARPKGNS